jgi:hypothetical protein
MRRYGLMVVALGLLLSSWTAAATVDLASAEQHLIAKYPAQDFYAHNLAIEKDIVSTLLKHPAAFHYGFVDLQNSIGPSILWSPDQKLKFYVFDVGQGAGMREFSSYAQYRYAQHVHLTAIKAGQIYDVTQIRVAQKPVYLLQSYYQGRTCSGAYEISALTLDHGRLKPAAIFYGKMKTLDRINIAHGCPQRRDQDQDPSDDYVRLSADNRYLDLRLVDAQGVAQNTFQRLVLTNNGYQYQGLIEH